MPALIPMTFFGIFLFTFVGVGRNGIRQSFVYAATVYTLCLVFVTELFSLWNVLQFETLLAFWTGLLILATLCLWLYGNRKATEQTLHAAWTSCRGSRFEIFSVLLILAIILVIAVVAPPNNWESMHVRMMRVVMWMQQKSVAHFPAGEVNQLYYPPLPEWNILHFQVLSGGDQFANMVHWFALAGCPILSSLIARELKQPFSVQVLAAVIAVTLPMGICQGSSTQGNLVVAFWLLAFVVFTLQHFQKPSGASLMCGGLAFGFALLSKGTAYAIVPLWAATCFLYGIVRAKGYKHRVRLATAGAGIVVVALLVNGGHYWRNYDLFGSPLAPPEGDVSRLNERINAFVLISNLVRNAALHWGVPAKEVNDFTLDTIRRVFGDQLDRIPGTTFGLPFFEAGIPFSLGEYHAGNFLHFWFLSASLLGILLFRRRFEFNAWTVCLALAVVLGTISFCGLLQWERWNTRYHTPLFMLGAPLGATFVAQILSRIGVRRKGRPSGPCALVPPPLNFIAGRRRSLIAGTFLVMSVPWVISNDIRPLYPLEIWQTYPSSTPSIFSRSRTLTYFSNNSWAWPYTQATDFLAAQDPKEVGIYMLEPDYIYPIWALLKDRLNTVPQFEYVEVKNPSGKLRINNAPPFVILLPKPTSLRIRNIEGVSYYPVYRDGKMAILRRLRAAQSASIEKALEGPPRMTSAGFEPLIRSALGVYLDRRQNSLVYVRDGCSPPAAHLSTEGIPVVGRPFRVSLSGWVRAKGMSNRQRWQWERGNDTEGWIKIPFQTGRRRTYEYTPTAADVGYSLRASAAYTDNGGNQVRVRIEPSSPVALAAQLLIGPRMPRTSAFFFLHLFPINRADRPSFDGKREDFLRFEFTPDPEFQVLLDERCMALRFPLPPFDIARIRTGESTLEGPIWEADISFHEIVGP